MSAMASLSRSPGFLIWMALGCAVLVACGGSSKRSPGNGSGGDTGDTPSGSGGSAGTHSTVGGRGGSAAPGGEAEGGVAEAGGNGGTAGAVVTACRKDADCIVEPACDLCADGSLACNRASCKAGTCKYVKDICDTAMCSADSQCPTSTIACTQCADGSEACPVVECVEGQCEQSFPRCAGGTDPCQGLACGAECDPCASGAACDPSAHAYCDVTGGCSSGVPQCSPPGSLCATVSDCPEAPASCIDCGNGTCAETSCESGKCGFGCRATNQNTCMANEDCPAAEGACTMCPNLKCAVPACLTNVCRLVCPL
jgi:hypothetical protein